MTMQTITLFSLTKTKYFDPCFNLVGSFSFCQEIKNKLNTFGINSHIRKQKNVCYLTIKGTRQLDKLFFNMYQTSTIYLDRKYKKYLCYLEEVKLLNRKL